MKALGAALMAFALAGCGYHVAGKADMMPKSVRTVAVVPWQNTTVRYRLTDRMAEAVQREFIARTRYHVVSDANGADAVLTGTILHYDGFPTVFDPATGRASVVQVSVRMRVELKDRDGKVLFSRPGIEFHDRYEISVSPGTYFDESAAALDRLSRDAARTIVSAVLENF